MKGMLSATWESQEAMAAKLGCPVVEEGLPLRAGLSTAACENWRSVRWFDRPQAHAKTKVPTTNLVEGGRGNGAESGGADCARDGVIDCDRGARAHARLPVQQGIPEETCLEFP